MDAVGGFPWGEVALSLNNEVALNKQQPGTLHFVTSLSDHMFNRIGIIGLPLSRRSYLVFYERDIPDMRIVGIDLGTTNSLVSFFEDDTTSLIANPSGAVITPSVLSLDEASGEILIGEAAKDRLITHPSLSIANFKRLMGSEAKMRLGKKSFTPIELSSLILQQLKSDAENHFGEQITEAVISVPAYFSDAQRKATKLAGELAGLKVERLVNEPTAAALAYGLHEKVQEQVFIVIDLGGGTLDISILDVFDDIIEVKASAGNNYFGGEDFTSALLKLFLSENKLKADKLSAQDNSKLYSAVNKLKCKLSEASDGAIHIELGKKTIEWHCTREHYVNSIQELLKTFRTPIERAVKDSQIDIEELESVILVGGATRMPWIRAEVSKLFRRLPLVHINPDEAIARGAAVQAALKAKNQSFSDVVLTDVCPYTLGVETTIEKAKKHYESGHFSPIIERNMTVPVSRESSFVTISDNQTDINFGIFQGESRLTKNNVNIGNLSINVPADKAGKQSVTVRFTYDINGILEVIIKSDSTGFTKSLIINSKNNGMSDEEIRASMAKLAEIKIHPRENLPNKELTARLERLYEENLGDKRAYIADILRTFEVALESQDPEHIEQVRNSILSNISHLESDIF